MTSRALCLLLALPLVACSGETASTTGGPSSTAPEAAVNVEVYTKDASQLCPLGDVHIDIGNPRVTPPDLAVDGADGASVACKVAQVDANLSAEATVSQATFSFSFKDVLTTDQKSATGTVTVKDPKGDDTYTSPPESPCVFQFAPSSAQTIAAGKVFIQFDCSELRNDKDPTKSCSSRYGYVYADRCAQK